MEQALFSADTSLPAVLFMHVCVCMCVCVYVCIHLCIHVCVHVCPAPGSKGVVSDAFAPLNQFWVRDRATNEVVRDDHGDILSFGAEELQVDAAIGQSAGQAASARVLLVGTEKQMLEISARRWCGQATMDWAVSQFNF